MELGPRTQDALHAAIARTGTSQRIWQTENLGDGFFDEHRGMYFGFDGEPITLRVWSALFEAPERLVEQEWILLRDCERVWVSTVWLGIDHNHARFLKDFPGEIDVDTRPWIFETMCFTAGRPRFGEIFASADFGDEQGQWRSATWEEALLQHAAAAAMAESGILSSEDDAFPARMSA